MVPNILSFFLGDVCDFTIQLNTAPTSLSSAFREFKNTTSDCMTACSENRDTCVAFAYRSSDKQCFRFFTSISSLSFTTDSDYIFFEKRCIRTIGKYVFNINEKFNSCNGKMIISWLSSSNISVCHFMMAYWISLEGVGETNAVNLTSVKYIN